MKPWLKIVLKIICLVFILGLFYWLINHSTYHEDRLLYFQYFSDELDNTSMSNVETSINNQSSPLYSKEYTIRSNLSFEEYNSSYRYYWDIRGMLKRDQNINLIFNKTEYIGLEKENTYLCEYNILANDTILINTERMILYHRFILVGNGKNITNFIFFTDVISDIAKNNPMHDEFLNSAHDKANFHIQNICDALGIEISKEEVHFVDSYLGSL